MQLVAAPCVSSGKKGGATVPSGLAAPGKMPKTAPPTLVASHAVAERILKIKHV
jgi:hypothetical protein